ncbi:hypothetical protein [Actinoplanes derwentensis]|uniref:YlxR domain-containing protein n=1 Tax=Actinoplanes derwentensis TaxID=113562 RepID=A0A1H2CK16_9ACTN|nr:hypothetical protein [Actinoplanes derwentensis]GID82569.1 hypothetical protein Ade03nite_14930 [Actinoplanes derwentensis]SDT70406.1 hypothetical protein SAMN04489716_5948 [Actinoplanes derwentensis]
MDRRTCWICGKKIDRDLAAIERAGERLRYVPFVRDVRVEGVVLAHPVCFANEQGVEALVVLVHERDYETVEKSGKGERLS